MPAPDDIAARLDRIEKLLTEIRNRLGEVELSQQATGLALEMLLTGGESVEPPADVAAMRNRPGSPALPCTDTGSAPLDAARLPGQDDPSERSSR